MSIGTKYRPVMKHGMRAVVWLLPVALIVGILWLTNSSVTPRKAEWANVEAAAKAGGYQLVNVEALKRLYENASRNILLVDVRQDWEYRTGHIRGALNFHMEPTWWSRWRKKGPLQAALGPDKDRTIVFY